MPVAARRMSRTIRSGIQIECKNREDHIVFFPRYNVVFFTAVAISALPQQHLLQTPSSPREKAMQLLRHN